MERGNPRRGPTRRTIRPIKRITIFKAALIAQKTPCKELGMMIVRILKLKATTFFKEVQQKVKKGRTRQRTNAVCILSVETMTLHNDFEIFKKN